MEMTLERRRCWILDHILSHTLTLTILGSCYSIGKQEQFSRVIHTQHTLSNHNHKIPCSGLLISQTINQKGLQSHTSHSQLYLEYTKPHVWPIQVGFGWSGDKPFQLLKKNHRAMFLMARNNILMYSYNIHLFI